MPGVMQNGYDYDDRNGRRPNPGLASSFDQYRRNDRRDDYPNDVYSKPNRNGHSSQNERFNWPDQSTDRTSLDGRTDVYKGHEPVYEVDHLATFTATRKEDAGLISLNEGLSKLRNMEVLTGIWTMRCLMVIERNYIVILDNQTGEEHDRFPIDVVYKPTAIVRNDPREIYNNLILFTVATGPKRGASEPNMHIFQSVSASAQEIADEIHSAKEGKPRLSQGHQRIPPAPSKPAPEPPLTSSASAFENNISSRRYMHERQASGGNQFVDPRGRDLDPIAFLDQQIALGSGLDSRRRENEPINSQSSAFSVVRSGANPGLAGGFLGSTDEPIMSKTTTTTVTRTKESSAEPRPLSGMYNIRNRPQVRDREDTDSLQGERIELDMQKLNACCDDIEKFVARLQYAAEAYKELENLRKERGKGKSKQMGDGIISMRAQPPTNDDYIDIFQKFKYAFNILARLKPYIHDPNAPELVHFLFTPLSLIYEASRNASNPSHLASRAVSPLLTREAKDLLLNCLTSKEQEFWMSLGDAWFLTREQWRGSVPVYMPRFYNSWQPAPSDIDDDPRGAMNQAVVAQMNQIRHRNEIEYAREKAADQVLSYPPVEERFPRPFSENRDYPLDNYSPHQTTPPPGALGTDPRVAGYQEYVERHIDRNKRLHEEVPQPSPQMSQRPMPNYDSFVRELRYKGARMCQVKHSRQGTNPKEISVEEGEIVELIDDLKKWWKVRNYLGDVGHAPYTILKEIKDGDNGYDDRPLEREFENNGLHVRNNSGGYSGQLPSLNDPYPQSQGNSATNYQQARPARRDMTDIDRVIETRPPPPPVHPVPQAPQAPPPPTAATNKTYDVPSPSTKANRPKMSSRSDSKDDLHNELRAKMSNVLLQNKSRPANRDVRITQHSTSAEVSEWLMGKQFTPKAVMLYREYNGADMFRLKRNEIERHLGREEGGRLESQLTVQKNISGYGTKSAAELNAILLRRKERSDYEANDESASVRLGTPPSFIPGPPPNMSSSNSEVDSDDLMGSMPANTLRDMLIRQRHKMFTDQFDDPATQQT